MKNTLLMSAALLTLALPGAALATPTGLRTITDVGCHHNNEVCWVNISGAPVGPAACSNNNIRFSTAQYGKNTLSLLTAAFLAGRQVNIEVQDSACFAGDLRFPTLNWLGFGP
jgi:hypothetical protein